MRRGSLRPTLLDRYLVGSLLGVSVTCFGVTLFMMMLERADRLIGQITASGGEVRFFFPMMASETPYYLGLAVPAAFFISMFIVIIRLDEGSEIEAMQSAGLSLARIALPWVAVGAVLGLVNLMIGGFLEPYGHYRFRAAQDMARQAGWSGRLDSGAIVSDGTSTLVADSADATGRRLRGVFISRMDPRGGESVLTAVFGRLYDEPDLKTVRIALSQARAFSRQPGGAVRVASFGRIDLLSARGRGAAIARRGEDVRELTLFELARAHWLPPAGMSRASIDAELYSRLARAASIPFLPLLALPLGIVSKRGRRTLGLIVAGLVLVCFHHGLVLVGSLAALGRLDPLLGVGGLFAALAAFSLWLFLGSLTRPGQTPLSGLLDGAALGVEQLARAWARARQALRPDRSRRLTGRMSLRTYVARQLVARTLTAAAVILVLLQIFELLGRAGDILARGVGVGGLGYYMMLQAPGMIRQGVGFAVFAGLLATLTGLAGSSEMTAMRAAGVSLRQFILMLLPMAIMAGAVDLVVADQLAPRSERATQRWLQATAPRAASAAPPARWFKIGRDVVRADRASPDGTALSGLSIYRRDADGLIVQSIQARSAAFAHRGWMLADAQGVSLKADGAAASREHRLAWPTSLAPADVVRIFEPTAQLSALEAYHGLHGGPTTNLGADVLRTRLFRLLAEPAAPLVMLLLAAPLVLAQSRSGPRLGTALYGVGGGLSYLVADGLLTASGQTGELPPLLAAWAAPVIFAMAACTVLLYAER